MAAIDERRRTIFVNLADDEYMNLKIRALRSRLTVGKYLAMLIRNDAKKGA